ncbi:unnamed protein product [Pleuronectes platessa]|uniref:Uncharacterized protein n=1 Tax=Pleuronectes platessa TaxID=8262 RepID=A0A9N7ZAB2_PLEPL|nr:unnamed protein product [Pleuronectes platessa]
MQQALHQRLAPPRPLWEEFTKPVVPPDWRMLWINYVSRADQTLPPPARSLYTAEAPRHDQAPITLTQLALATPLSSRCCSARASTPADYLSRALRAAPHPSRLPHHHSPVQKLRAAITLLSSPQIQMAGCVRRTVALEAGQAAELQKRDRGDSVRPETEESG